MQLYTASSSLSKGQRHSLGKPRHSWDHESECVYANPLALSSYADTKHASTLTQ